MRHPVSKDDIEITEGNEVAVFYKGKEICTFKVGESSILLAGHDKPTPICEMRAIFRRLENLTIKGKK